MWYILEEFLILKNMCNKSSSDLTMSQTFITVNYSEIMTCKPVLSKSITYFETDHFGSEFKHFKIATNFRIYHISVHFNLALHHNLILI